MTNRQPASCVAGLLAGLVVLFAPAGVSADESDSPRCIDPGGFEWQIPCALIPDPCLTEGTTLFHMQACEPTDPTIGEWCASYPTHPACSGVPSVAPPDLPRTGATATLPIVASVLLLTGLLCRLPRRRA